MRGGIFPITKRNIIVVGTSAGGVEALCELNKHLPEKLDASVFVVMHIGTESMLPEILNRCGKLPAAAAEHEKRYKSGCIYCAPALCHLSIKDHMTVLTRGPRENGHRPAVDVLFRSAARAHRAKVIGVVLSGGRDDGSAGLYAIKAPGRCGHCPGSSRSPHTEHAAERAQYGRRRFLSASSPDR
jgi:two-component system, chemotaxis family, protein-glutamate methylesterase/glutaminase